MARFDKCTPWKMNIINMDPQVWMLWKGVYTWDVWVFVFVFRGVHMLDHGNSFVFENEPLKSMKERVSCQTNVFANGRCVFWWAHNDANGLLFLKNRIHGTQIHGGGWNMMFLFRSRLNLQVPAVGCFGRFKVYRGLYRFFWNPAARSRLPSH